MPRNGSYIALRHSTIPLLDAQEGIWFAQRHADPGPFFYTGEYIDIHGPVDIPIFRRALAQAVREAQALHVSLTEGAQRPGQVLGAEPEWSLPVIDVRAEDDPQAAAEAWMQAELAGGAPLFSFALFQVASDRWFWYQGYNHIVMDGLGRAMMADRVSSLYLALRDGAQPRPASFGLLADLLAEQAHYHESGQAQQDRDYWRAYLAGRPEMPGIPGHGQAAPGSVLRQTGHLPGAAVARLRELTRDTGVSWPRFVVAGLAAYVGRMSGADEAVFSLPVTGRLTPLARRTPSTMANVLPLRVRVDPAASLRSTARHVAEQVNQLLAHQRYRGESLRREFGAAGDGRWYFGPFLNIMSFDRDPQFAGQRATIHDLSSRKVEEFNVVVGKIGRASCRERV